MIDELSETWNSLETEAAGSRVSAILRRRICLSSANKIYVGLTVPAGQRLVLFRVSRGSEIDESKLPTSEGVRTSFVNVPDDPAECICLSIRLHDRQYEEVFTSLVADLVAATQDAHNDRLLIEQCIERWQAFMRMHGHDGLSPIEQRGLFGELWFLSEYIFPSCTPKDAIDSWKGPAGRPQDFNLYGIAVEIKTTIGKSHTVIHIANELQLDDSVVDQLMLGHIRLIESRTNSKSLVEMVASLREELASSAGARAEFENTLIEAGCLDAHEKRYKQPAYRIREFDAYRVEEGFPRIVSADFDQAIGDVRYSIAVAGIGSFQISNDNLRALLGEAGNA